MFDSTTHCTRCAEALVERSVVSRASAGHASPRSAPSTPPDSTQATEWIILVARDEEDLFTHLERAFARDDKVQIIMDRRKDYRRNPPGVEERLRIHGAVVVRRARRRAAPDTCNS